MSKRKPQTPKQKFLQKVEGIKARYQAEKGQKSPRGYKSSRPYLKALAEYNSKAVDLYRAKDKAAEISAGLLAADLGQAKDKAAERRAKRAYARREQRRKAKVEREIKEASEGPIIVVQETASWNTRSVVLAEIADSDRWIVTAQEGGELRKFSSEEPFELSAYLSRKYQQHQAKATRKKGKDYTTATVTSWDDPGGGRVIEIVWQEDLKREEKE